VHPTALEGCTTVTDKQAMATSLAIANTAETFSNVTKDGQDNIEYS